MIFFSSDLHFNHNQPFIYLKRNFPSVEVMNNTIIKNFYEKVSSDDDLYLLGDLIMGDADISIKYVRQLPGRIHVIWGNHDTDKKKALIEQCFNVVEIIGYAGLLKYDKFHFYMSHYPTATENFDIDKPLQRRILALSGHTHLKDKFDPCGSYNVAVDAHNCYPVSIEDIIQDFKKKVE